MLHCAETLHCAEKRRTSFLRTTTPSSAATPGSITRLHSPAAETNPSSQFADSIVELPAAQQLRISVPYGFADNLTPTETRDPQTKHSGHVLPEGTRAQGPAFASFSGILYSARSLS
jgi:hypothetical protein